MSKNICIYIKPVQRIYYHENIGSATLLVFVPYPTYPRSN